MKQTQGRITISIDGYTRVCLTVIAVLLTILIIGLWANGPAPITGEQAVAAPAPKTDGILLDARAQRVAMLKTARETNRKLDKIISVLTSGEVQVVLAEPGEKKGKSNVGKKSTGNKFASAGFFDRLGPEERTSAAFTLVELIVVLIVMAIAAAMIVPFAVSTSGLQAQSAASLTMSDLEYAQNQAIVTQAPVTVTFSVAGNSYTVSNESGTLIHPITKQAYIVDFDTNSGFDSVSMSAASFGSGSTVTFDALGAPDNNGTVTYVAGSHAYTVTVASISGRVTVAKTQ